MCQRVEKYQCVTYAMKGKIADSVLLDTEKIPCVRAITLSRKVKIQRWIESSLKAHTCMCVSITVRKTESQDMYSIALKLFEWHSLQAKMCSGTNCVFFQSLRHIMLLLLFFCMNSFFVLHELLWLFRMIFTLFEKSWWKIILTFQMEYC